MFRDILLNNVLNEAKQTLFEEKVQNKLTQNLCRVMLELKKKKKKKIQLHYKKIIMPTLNILFIALHAFLNFK